VGWPAGATALFLAVRGLRESVLSTGLMVVAVAVGIGFEVPSTANIEGYRAELLSQSLDSGSGDVRVRPGRGPLVRDADALARRIARHPGVLEADPVLSLPASVRGRGHAASLSVIGVEPGARFHPYRLTAGQPLADGDGPRGILLGTSVARNLGVSVGDEVEATLLLSTYPRLVLDDGGFETYAFVVRGLVGFNAADNAYVSRAFLAPELGDEHAASAVLVHIADHEAAPAFAAAIGRGEPGVRVRAWMDDSPYLRSSVQAAKTLAGASWVMGVLAVGIPVLALLYISTLHRRRQIGLLTAMGFSRRDLFATFLLQALVLGLAGVTVGGLLASSLVRYLVAHPIFDWYGFVVRPVLTPGALAKTAGAILATALVAGTYPAFRAARMDPSRILRGIE
jgi:ABC-type lipoprotein release transport system permease subunit